MAALTPKALSGLHDAMAGHVRSGLIPGLITAVARADETVVDLIGWSTPEGDTPIRRNTLFRISSMTKPVVAVAALQLVAAGTLRLDQPVASVLPELADRQVLRDPHGPIDATEPAVRDFTVHDLLTYRCGYGFDLDLFPDAPVLQAAQELGLAIGPPVPGSRLQPDEWLRRLATLPLLAQPGQRWLYDTPANIIGVLVARISGEDLSEYLQHNIFEPQGMVDTSFWVPPEKLGRFLPSYDTDQKSGELIEYDAVEGQWSQPPSFPSGANGLVSTVDDLLAFSRMLLGGGNYREHSLLPTELVAEMTTDQLAQSQHGSMLLDPRGWGLGLAVDPVTGQFGWDGGLGTSWVADPQTGTTGILLTQRTMSMETWGVLSDFTASFQELCQ